MTLNLQPIEKIDNLTPADFQEHYLKPQKPVVLTNYGKDWVAREKWTFDYFKKNHGDLMVPLYSRPFANSGDSYTSAQQEMRFAEYLELIESEPTQLRMFLFNIFKHVPSLCNDFDFPPFVNKYYTKYPFVFFGGATSWVDVHYDLDLSDLFLTQFAGEKKIILFSPEYSTHLYRHPLTVSCNVDLREPDLSRYPQLKNAKGYICDLKQGETVYMPSGYWHYVYYTTGGFSLTLRAPAEKLFRRLEGIYNIFRLTVIDHSISKIIGGERWYEIKERMAVKKAGRLANIS